MIGFNKIKSKHAQIMILVIVIFAVVLVIGIGLLFHSRSFRDVTSLQVDTEKAYSLASTGIEVGEKHLIDNPCGADLNQTYSIGEGSAQVEVVSNFADSKLTSNIASTGSYGRSKRILTKTITSCIEGWAKAYGIGNRYQITFNVKPISDGGYILAGRYSGDFHLAKISSDGKTVEWSNRYGWVGTSENLLCFKETVDNKYILGGSTNNPDNGAGGHDFFFVKVDSDGSCEWARTYGGSFNDFLTCFLETSDGYILAGNTISFGTAVGTSNDILLIKTDINGNLATPPAPGTWARTYGHTTLTMSDIVNSMQQIPMSNPDGYLLGGHSNCFGRAANQDAFLIRTDLDGNVSWANTYGKDKEDVILTLDLDKNGEFILLGGRSKSFGSDDDDFLFIRAAESDGDVGPAGTWARTYYTGSGTDQLRSFCQRNEEYVLGGGTNADTDYLLIKTNSDGDAGDGYAGTWAKSYGGDDTDLFLGLTQINDGDYILTGGTKSFGTGGTSPTDIMVIKTDSSGDLSCCNITEYLTSSIGVRIHMPPNIEINYYNATDFQTYDHGSDFNITVGNFNDVLNESDTSNLNITAICPLIE